MIESEQKKSKAAISIMTTVGPSIVGRIWCIKEDVLLCLLSYIL